MGGTIVCQELIAANFNHETVGPSEDEPAPRSTRDSLLTRAFSSQGAFDATSDTADTIKNTSDEPVRRSSRTIAPPYEFQFEVQKTGLDDKLGMEVKHLQGKLEVAHISPEGAIERTNKLNKAMKPPGETLQLGDIIQRVNHIDKSDRQMVVECRLKNELTFCVARTKIASFAC